MPETHRQLELETLEKLDMLHQIGQSRTLFGKNLERELEIYVTFFY